jgi:hypothetical protein
MLLFVIPFLVQLFGDLPLTAKRILLSINLVGWITMEFFELPEIFIYGIRIYVENGWNMLDQLSLVFPIYFYMMIAKPVDTLVNDHHSVQFKNTEFDEKHDVTE